jgi:hypothetical protein
MGLELDIQRFKIMAETEANKRGKNSGGVLAKGALISPSSWHSMLQALSNLFLRPSGQHVTD